MPRAPTPKLVPRKPPPIPRDEAAAELEVMLARLREMQNRARDADIRDAYKVAADRIGAAIYRLRQPGPVVIGAASQRRRKDGGE